MSANHIKGGKEREPPIKDIPLPTHVQRALLIRSNGSSWKVAAEFFGMDYRTLRKYIRDHLDATDLLERQTQDALDQAIANSLQLLI